MHSLFSILSINGGGILGVGVLWAISQVFAKPKEEFNVFAGTSVGALIIGLLLVKKDSKTALKTFLQYYPRIFKKRWPWQLALGRSKYTNDYYKCLKEIFGDLKCEDVIQRFFITSVRTDGEKGFKVWSNQDKGVYFRDVMASSMVAPNFFERILIYVKGLYEGCFVDGGLAQNNPSMCAISALLNDGVDLEHIRCLNFGTSGKRSGEKLPVRFFRTKMLKWIIENITVWNVQATDYFCRSLLGDRYVSLKPDNLSHIAMDDVESVDEIIQIWDGYIAYRKASMIEFSSGILMGWDGSSELGRSNRD